MECDIDVRLSMGCGDRTLFDRMREETDPSIDEHVPKFQVQFEVVVGSQIMPVSRRVIHKVDAERGALPRNCCLHSHFCHYLFDASFDPLPERLDMTVNFSILFEEPFNRSDCGPGWNRVGIVGSGEQYPAGGHRVDKAIHQLLRAAKYRDGKSVCDSLAEYTQIRLNPRNTGIASQGMTKASLHFVEYENEAEFIRQSAQSGQVARSWFHNPDILQYRLDNQCGDRMPFTNVLHRWKIVEVDTVN